ncbi:hypothetical protein V8C35DRAFT_291364 [Trichoderma chlorosporum]
MQTRRSKKAVEPEPEPEPAPLSSPPPQPTRRNPPRASKRRGNDVAIRNSSFSSSPPLSSPPSSPPIRPSRFPPLPHALPPSTLPSLPPATPSHPSPVLPSIEPPKGLTSVPRKGSIVFDPKPRRGAPRQLSVSSIATNPRRDNSDDEYDETIEPEPKTASQLLEEEMAQREVEEAEHEIKLEAVTSLARDAKNLIGQFQNKARPSYEKVLLIKLQTFRASRSIFLAPRQASLFLDWDWMNNVEGDISETMSVTIPLSIKLANIATALALIESIESEGDNPVPFLEAVDALFPLHFAAEETQYPKTSLEIRTQRAIESIARSPQATDLRGMLGHAFCNMNAPDAPSNYGALFSKGPYKPLANLNHESLVDVCSNRVSEIWQILSDGGKRGIRTPVNLPSIRAQYPLKSMLEDLKEWLMARYSTISHLLSKAEQERVAKDEERLREQWRAEEQRLFREQQKAREEQQRVKEKELRAREEAQRSREAVKQAQEQERRAREAAAQRAKEKEKHTQEQERSRNERLLLPDRVRKEEMRRRQEEYPSLPPSDDEDSYPDASREASSQDMFDSQPEPPPQRFKSRDRESSLFMGRQLVGLLGGVSLSQPSTSTSSRKRSYQQSGYHSESESLSDSQEEEEHEAEEEDEEEEDDFEVDTRPINRSKTTTSSVTLGRHRELQRERDDRDHHSSREEQRPIKRSKTASSSAPTSQTQEQQKENRHPTAQTSTAAPLPSAPSSSKPDFAAIQRIKDQARISARLSQPQSLKKRFVWSDRDSAVLIELIAKRAAGWATIFKEDSHRFELPRNAQAYRDRARNMKVDFLISDAVLPRGFDMVALSKKEIERLEKMGKNPARRERDVDGNGRPTNTKAGMHLLDS